MKEPPFTHLCTSRIAFVAMHILCSALMAGYVSPCSEHQPTRLETEYKMSTGVSMSDRAGQKTDSVFYSVLLKEINER